MATKKNMIFLLVVLAVLVINLVPPGIVPDNSLYFKDLEYLGLYNANPFLTGEAAGVFNMPLNTNHVILSALRLLPGAVFPNAIISIFYIAVLALSFIFLYKSAKGYAKLIAVALALMLTAKKYLWHIFTILPFGGIYTFLISAVCVITAVCINKRITLKSLAAMTALVLAFAMFDNATALCAALLGVVVIFLTKLGATKGVKVMTATAGVIIIALSLIFGITYKPVDYDTNISTAYNYGVKHYELIEASTSYSQVVAFYFKNPEYLVKHGQTLLNNAFYEGENAPFSLWNTIKVKLIPLNILVFALISVVIIVFAIIQHKKYGKLCVIAVVLAIMQWVALYTQGIIFGISNLDKNLLLFNLLFDILLAYVIVSAVYIIKSRRNDLKEKYGVNQ